MAKRNSKRKQPTAKRLRLVPRPVKGKGTPLPAETGWRLAFKLAQARGDRLDENEERLRQYRKGGNTFEVEIDGETITDVAKAARLVQAMAAEVSAPFRRQQRREPDPKELYAAVSKRHRIKHTKGRHLGDPVSESWFRRHLHPER